MKLDTLLLDHVDQLISNVSSDASNLAYGRTLKTLNEGCIISLSILPLASLCSCFGAQVACVRCGTVNVLLFELHKQKNYHMLYQQTCNK